MQLRMREWFASMPKLRHGHDGQIGEGGHGDLSGYNHLGTAPIWPLHQPIRSMGGRCVLVLRWWWSCGSTIVLGYGKFGTTIAVIDKWSRLWQAGG